MEQKKQKLAVVLCLVLFVICGLVSVVFSKSKSSEWEETKGSQIVISEILPSNRTYPSPEGEHLDFIEVHNLSGNSVDISGFMLSDDLSSIGYTFPSGTILPAYGYAVCWCSPDSQDDRFAAFGISREGGETVYLYNNANVLVDEKAVPLTPVNTALIRVGENLWEEGAFATPGYPNTEEGYRQWLQTAPEGAVQVAITEVMTDNSCFVAAPGGKLCDWIELTNYGTAVAVLSGAYLSNDPEDLLKWQISDLVIEPGASAIVYCTGSENGEGEAPFALSKQGCTITLTGQLGNTMSQVTCPGLLTDHSWARNAEGSYEMTDRPTPGYENSQKGYEDWLTSVGAEEATVVISEVMTGNRSTILSREGILCDWVELTNTGTKAVCLDGAYLSDDPAERGKWVIGTMTLQPGESRVIPCAGSAAGEEEVDFALDSSGCTLILSGSQGNIITEITCPALDGDRVWALQQDGTYRQTDLPTPGFANTQENYLAYRSAQLPLGDIAITEVMSANDKYLMQSDGQYYDWVELTNISEKTVELSDYSLSNNSDSSKAFSLPQRSLKPGERIVVICSAKDGFAGKYIHAPFTLSAQECWLYVTDSQGNFSDYMRIYDIPEGCTMGRSEEGGEICYFAQPTPGRMNGSGTMQISVNPQVLTAPGVYNGISSLSVEVTGEGAIHYTTDGSVPTVEDPVYAGPLRFSATTVLRMAAFEAGKLRSDVVTASYIINEDHTLPVVSLVADPEALFGAEGIYGQSLPFDEEILCSLSLFEESGSFSIDGGLEMMATNTAYPDKKSMKVNFRGRYGSSVLGYEVFGQDGPQLVDGLCLQAGSEHGATLFRDELFAQLCLDFTDAVPAQHYKFCVLYINGAYYGIYSLKEDIGQTLYSQAMDVAALDVTVIEESPQWGTELYALARYCKENNLADAEAFAVFENQMDTENLIDWMVLQGYCGNSSISGDLRYFRTPETDNQWQLGFFDLDGGFTDRIGFKGVFGTDRTNGYRCFTKSIAENPQSRQLLLERLAQALNTTLSEENVLSWIDYFEGLLAPEIAAERARWGGDADVWQADVDRLRIWLTRYDHEALLLQSLREAIGLTDEEVEAFFTNR